MSKWDWLVFMCLVGLAVSGAVLIYQIATCLPSLDDIPHWVEKILKFGGILNYANP